MSLRKEIRKIAKKEGFNNISDFVEDFINQGRYLSDFQYHIAKEYGLYYSYDGLYSAIRNDLDFVLQGTRGKIVREREDFEEKKLELLAEGENFKKQKTREKWIKKVNALGFASIRSAIQSLEKQFLKTEVAKMLETTYQNYCYRKRKMKNKQ
jgi:hypothetical protein